MTNATKPEGLLARYAEWHDPASREEIILRHVPLVHHAIGRLGLSAGQVVDYEDLVSQGLLGLIEAVDRYDPAHGTQFSTYATLLIRGRVLDYLRAQDWLSRAARRRAQAVQQAIYELWSQLRRTPDEAELAEHLGMERTEVQQGLTDASRVILSLDAFADFNQEEDISIHEVIADEDQPSPAQQLDNATLQELVVNALQQLSEREQLILSLYYYEELTLKEIGQVLGVTESRVSQLHARAVMNLRALLAAEAPGAALPLGIPAERGQTLEYSGQEAASHA